MHEDWESQLGPDAQAKVAEIYDTRVRTNTEVTRLACMQIEHRLTLIGKNAALRERLGYPSSRRWREWDKRLKNVRNTLAHGGNVLDVAPEPDDAIGLIEDVRRFAEAAWREAGSSQPAESRRQR